MAKTIQQWQRQAQLAQELGDIDAELEARRAIKSMQQVTPQEEPSFGDQVMGTAETLATIGTSSIAEPAAGIAGLVNTALFGGEYGADAVDRVRDALTYDPKTEEGRRQLMAVGKTLQPVVEVLEAAERASGEAGYDLAGPVGGAIGETLPTALMELAGVKGIRGGSRIKQSGPTAQEQQILEAGAQRDVPILTSDISPPETFVGKSVQALSERLGPLGTGTARQAQQSAREEAVRGFAEQFDISPTEMPDFSADIVRNLNQKSAKNFEKAGGIRKTAVEALDQYGVVPVEKTLSQIETQLKRQERLGAKADESLISNLQNIESAIQNGDFSLVKDIRTEVIDDLKALRRSEDPRAEASLQAVKIAIDDDLLNFAKANDRSAAAKWQQSNRLFADEFSRTRDSELKRILKSGDTTPEKVIPLLRGGKPSELKRLKTSLDETGIKSAQQAIIQEALDKSGFFRDLGTDQVNVNRFTTALNDRNLSKAVDVFFTGKDKAEIQGLTRLLDATRRAQDASAAPPTGVQNFLLLAGGGGLGAGAAVSPAATIGATAVGSALAKSYESRPFRNLLLKIKNTKKGSKAETEALELALPFVLAELQAAKTRQEEQ